MPEIALQHRTIADLSKPQPPVPTGVWKLRAIKMSAKDVTKKDREGNEYETQEYLLTVEPIEPTASVDPEALAEIDPATGKPAHDGKRMFLRFTVSFRPELNSLLSAVKAMGIPETESLAGIVDGNLVKGRTVYGEVYNRSYKRNDGGDGTEQRVRSWAANGGEGIAL
jgi:hypothetical protein